MAAPSTLSLPQLLVLAIGLMLCSTMFVRVEGRADPLEQQTNFAKEMVDKHNTVRKSMGLGTLTWNATVAEHAQRYANQRSGDCQLEHSNGPYGENIYTASGGTLENAAAAVKAWADEKSDFNYDTNTCNSGKQCGHYTQIVWKNSQQIGCAYVKCTNNAYWVVCNYDPPGNYVGERPY